MGDAGIIKMKIYDAHMHIDTLTETPAEDLREYMEKSNLEKAVLILNTSEEYRIFAEKIVGEKFFENKFYVVIGLNKHDMFLDEGKELCKRLKQKYCIKLHPRLFQMTEEETKWYIEQIWKEKPDVVVVDDFLYGCEVPHYYNIDLICKLAKEFAEMKIVMAHSGGVNLLEHVMRTKGLKNIYYDLSLTCNYLADTSVFKDIGWLIKFLGDRAMFGSDYPTFTVRQAREKMEEVFEDLEEPEKYYKQIFETNIHKVYGGKRDE